MTIPRNAAKPLLGILLCYAGACLAQDAAPLGEPPSTTEINHLLSSGDPRLVAWGAHYALVEKAQGVASQLLDLADRWQATTADSNAEEPNAVPRDQTDEHDALAAVLDAIIQLHLNVSSAMLRNLSGDFPNQVAILLTGLPLEQAQSLSQEFYHLDPKTLGAHNLQYVSAVLLAKDPPAGFAADLFSSIHNRATIKITTPGRPEGDGYGGGSGVGCAMGESHSDWPEFGIYQLSAGKIGDSFVLMDGPDPIYALRSKTRFDTGDKCENFTFLVLGPEERRRFVARWLGADPDDLEWETEAADTIVYQSDEQFYRELRAFIAGEQEKYRATAAALVEKNLIAVSEQDDALPYLELKFNDQRGPDASPIAEPASLPPHVSWPKQPTQP
jgi:hypothetical protein